jgi:hypothetical protein
MKDVIRTTVVMLVAGIFFYSCKKSDDQPADIPYEIERISPTTFDTRGWKVQQVNIVSGTTVFADQSDNVKVVCAPENSSSPWLVQGGVSMNLPTSTDATLRRVRLRKGGYSGTLLSDLTELKYSTYVVHNATTNMVLQIDVTNDDTKDFNIYFEPREDTKPFQLNTWQQWDALQGKWHAEAAIVTLPQSMSNSPFTLQQVIGAFPNARIIDTPPSGHNGEGVRFTIGGTPRDLFDNTVGYFDALIIGTKKQQKPTLYDFSCN